MKKTTIAVAQMGSILKDKKANINKAISIMKEASKKDANIVLFPELFITGYNLEKIKDDLEELSENLLGETVKELKNAARENKIYVIIGLVLKDEKNNNFKNSSILIDSNGDILGQYSKNHMFGEEGMHFQRDNQYPVFDTEFGKIGIAICYDINFPETVRILSIGGADIVFVLAAWRIQDESKWNLLTNTRALENTVFLAAANQYVEYDNLHLFGGSKIVNPKGETLIQSTCKGDELLIQEIDLSELEILRKNNPYLKDRQVQGYGKLLENRNS